MKKPTKTKPKYNFIVAPNFSEKEIKKVAKLAEKGDIRAKMDIILHNQLVANYN